MSEFGSSKSFSSVSEPSSSQPSSSDGPPPDSSSSHSSGEPSSSSEEVHTCHRCGNCCWSDKSWFEIAYEAYGRTYHASEDCTGDWFSEWNAVTRINGGNLLRVDFVEAIGNTVVWEATGVTLEQGGGMNTAHGLITTSGRVRIAASCITGTKIVQCFDQSDNEWLLYDPVEFSDCCGYAKHVDGPCESVVPGESSHNIIDIDIELKNNPCCRDAVTDECFQHFNGDCRGDCDEEPSSSSESSESSGENPLP